jgi:hypothetical protein
MPKFMLSKELKLNLSGVTLADNIVELTCPQCGKKYEIGHNFCKEDGANLIKAEIHQPYINELHKYLTMRLKEYFTLTKVQISTPNIVYFKGSLKGFWERSITSGNIAFKGENDTLKLKADGTSDLGYYYWVFGILAFITTLLIPAISAFFWGAFLFGLVFFSDK